ncbi:MAG: lysophospholipid acyltransferase family protein [Deltaproteobacteria bacterium]|jgi:predicted LPLAT superfamily acyltransferase|nr:lysophospholipid acyltransferase family protein [Deltaproteobacteria bacterium]
MKWARRSLGSRLQYQVFQVIVRCRALPLARALLAMVVLYYTLLPHVRRRCFSYLRRRFGRADGWTGFVHAYRLYLNFGQILLDRMVAGMTGRFPRCSTAPEVLAELLAAARNPKGCILLTAHTGAWQVGLAELEQLDRPVHVVQIHDPDTHYFGGGGERALYTIDGAEPIGAFVEMTAALRRGEIVCLMGDRLSREREQSVAAPFLGGRIALPVGAYALASMTEAEVLMLFTVREKGLTRAIQAERIRVPPALPRHDPAVFLPFAARFAQALEAFVQAYPYQFFNFYNMWLDEDDNTSS